MGKRQVLISFDLPSLLPNVICFKAAVEQRSRGWSRYRTVQGGNFVRTNFQEGAGG